MPVFGYKALNKQGGETTGSTEAETPTEARAKLRAEGLYAVQMEPVRPAVRRRLFGGGSSARRLARLALFTNQLAMLLRSGAPLLEALDALARQTDDKGLASAIRDVHERVRGGSNLAKALSAHPQYFDELYANVIHAGEMSGELAAVCSHLASNLARRGRLAAKVTAALTYPIVMAVVGAMVIAFLMISVVPKMIRVLEEQGKVLPWPTEVLRAVSAFLSGWWWLLLAVVGVSYVVLRTLKNRPSGRRAFERLKMRLPVVGPLVRKSAIARLSTTLSTLLASGLSILDAIDIAGKAAGSSMLAEEMKRVREAVTAGSDLAGAVASSSILPPAIGCAVSVGEASAQLETVLQEIAESYDLEVEIASQKLTDVLTPLLIVVLGAVVGFVVAAVILPITDLSAIS